MTDPAQELLRMLRADQTAAKWDMDEAMHKHGYTATAQQKAAARTRYQRATRLVDLAEQLTKREATL